MVRGCVQRDFDQRLPAIGPLKSQLSDACPFNRRSEEGADRSHGRPLRTETGNFQRFPGQ